MRDPYQVVKTLRVTEKATDLTAKRNQYVLAVDKRANKAEIRHAVQKLFKVKVLAVNTLHVRGKARRERTLQFGRTPSWKKAIVTLKTGDKIQIE
jgi:large subunit ribosomal protein L23